MIDEFENGLHYSVQEKIWALIFKLAEQLNIQVFATTHSWDCIESFTKVAIDYQGSEGVLFRMGRSVRTSDNGKVIATVFDENQLQNITHADVEVRCWAKISYSWKAKPTEDFLKCCVMG